MADPINRSLLVFASAYLFLLPTNAATFGVSVAFGGALLCALVAYIRAWRRPATRIAMAGPSVLVPLALWSLWSCASLAWSADPVYSRGQLAREIMDSLAVMFIFYVAGREASGLRVLIGAALASFACFALLAIGMRVVTGAWDPGRFHHGVGAWATWIVIVAPFLFALIVPPPAGFGGGPRLLVIGFLLLALMIATARMTDNRIVWIALATVFATASLIAAIRWPHTFIRTPLHWLAPLCVLLIVLGLALADTIEERAQISAKGDVAISIERDPRRVLWEHVIGYLEARPLTGYGFGRLILEKRFTAETGNALLSHPHNVFVSQWLQTGLVGMIAFAAFVAALTLRYVRFARSRDDTLAFVGVIGIVLLAGFVTKDLTDDFLFRSNAKELWAMTAMLLGYGMRRERTLDEAERALAVTATGERNDSLPDAVRSAAASASVPPRQSQSA